MGELPAELFGDVAPPHLAAAWPKRLGNFPFWRGTERLLDALEVAYQPANADWKSFAELLVDPASEALVTCLDGEVQPVS